MKRIFLKMNKHDSRYRSPGNIRLSSRRKRRSGESLKTYWKRRKELEEYIQANRNQESNELNILVNRNLTVIEHNDQENASGTSCQLNALVEGNQTATEPKIEADCSQISIEPDNSQISIQPDNSQISVQPNSSQISVEPNIKASDSRMKSNTDSRNKKTSKCFSRIHGRRIVDINHFFKELQLLMKHSQFGCNLSDIVIIEDKRKGLLSGFQCICFCCKFEKVIWTEDPESSGRNINSDVVAGMVSLGGGFENMKEFCREMSLPSLDLTEYNKISRTLEANARDEAEFREQVEMEVEYDDEENTDVDHEMERLIDKVKVEEMDGAFVEHSSHGRSELVVKQEVLEDWESAADCGAIQSNGVAVEKDSAMPLDNGILMENTAEIDGQTTNASHETPASGSGNSIPTVAIGEVQEDSSISSSVLDPSKPSTERSTLRCEDCSLEFPSPEFLQTHSCSKRSDNLSSAMTNQTTDGNSNSCTEMFSDLPQVMPSTRVQDQLAELKLATAHKKSALNVAVKRAKEVTKWLNLRETAKSEKAQHLKALEKAINMKDELGLTGHKMHMEQRALITDMEMRATERVQNALAYEKHVKEKLELAFEELYSSLEAAVEATSRQELALVELENVIKDDRNSTILPEEDKAARKTADKLGVERVLRNYCQD